MSHVSHYSPNTWGNFTAVGSRGSRFGLIGHYSEDVTKWLAANPGFNGTIYFDYGNDEPQVDVTEVFFPEAEDDAGMVGGTAIGMAQVAA